MTVVPDVIRPDLTERFRQLRPFDLAEVSLVEYLTQKKRPIERRDEIALRRTLNLARVWVIEQPGKDAMAIGPELSAFRQSAAPLLELLAAQKRLHPEDLTQEARRIAPLYQSSFRSVLEKFPRLPRARLEREINHKKMALAVGGGGGCGYIHLGAFTYLKSIGVVPSLLSAASMGSIMGLFRARTALYDEDFIRSVNKKMTFSRVFKVLDSKTRYAMPGTLRLYLRNALLEYFLKDNQPFTLGDLEIPFICAVTGVRRDRSKEARRYEEMFARNLGQGPIGRLLHVKDLVTNLATFLADLVSTPGALQPIALGLDDETRSFDAIDAAGFSSALPGVIQYDITRDDGRMHALVQSILKKHDVVHLTDGGLIANVPARFAWEYVQSGKLDTRNVFVLGLDCFAPRIGRNMLFLPLQRLAAESVEQDRAFTQAMFTYKRPLTPTSLVPGIDAVERVTRRGQEELSSMGPFLKKMIEPLDPPT